MFFHVEAIFCKTFKPLQTQNFKIAHIVSWLLFPLLLVYLLLMSADYESVYYLNFICFHSLFFLLYFSILLPVNFLKHGFYLISCQPMDEIQMINVEYKGFSANTMRCLLQPWSRHRSL